jgi:hypothetical protein
MALLPWDEVTWLDAVLGLDPTADPRVTTGMFHRDDLDLLKETVWAAGLDPTPESARRWLWRARRRLLRELRDTGWRRQDIALEMLAFHLAKRERAFQPAPRGGVTSPCRVRRPGGPVDREPVCLTCHPRGPTWQEVVRDWERRDKETETPGGTLKILRTQRRGSREKIFRPCRGFRGF